MIRGAIIGGVVAVILDAGYVLDFSLGDTLFGATLAALALFYLLFSPGYGETDGLAILLMFAFPFVAKIVMGASI